MFSSSFADHRPNWVAHRRMSSSPPLLGTSHRLNSGNLHRQRAVTTPARLRLHRPGNQARPRVRASPSTKGCTIIARGHHRRQPSTPTTSSQVPHRRQHHQSWSSSKPTGLIPEIYYLYNSIAINNNLFVFVHSTSPPESQFIIIIISTLMC